MGTAKHILIIAALLLVLPQDYVHAAKKTASRKKARKPAATSALKADQARQVEQAEKAGKSEKWDRLRIVYTGSTRKSTSIYLISALEKIAGSGGGLKVRKAAIVPSLRIKNLAIFSNVGEDVAASLGNSYEAAASKFVPSKTVDVIGSNFDLLFGTTELKYPVVDKIDSFFSERNVPVSRTSAQLGKVTGTDGKTYDAIMLSDPNSFDNDVWQAQTCFRYAVSAGGSTGEVVSFGNYYGGYSTLIAMLEDQLKDTSENVLLLDTGGSLGEYGFKYVSPILKLLEYDAILPSLADITNEYENIVASRDKFNFVTSNIFDYATNKPLARDHIIIEKNGVKIGIIGLISPGHTPKCYIKDPAETAAELLKRIGDDVNMVIALADVEPKELAQLESMPGLSMIIGKDQDDPPPFPVEYIKFTQKSDSILRSAYFTGSVGNKYFSSLKFYYKMEVGMLDEKALLWERFPLDIYSKKNLAVQELENKSIINSFSAKDPILLPDYRDLFQEKKEKDFTYSPEELSMLMANVLLKATDSDLAIVPKRTSLSTSVTGAVPESIIRAWFREKNGSILITRVDGGTLNSIIATMSQYNELKDPTRPPAVIAGLASDGTVKDKPISSTEYYTVVTTKQVFDAVDIYPAFRGLSASDEKFVFTDGGVSADSGGKKLDSSEVLVSYLKKKRPAGWNSELEGLLTDPGIGHEGPYWRINLKNVAFEYKNYRVIASEDYLNIPDPRVVPTEERNIATTIDTSFELYGRRWNWETGSILEYTASRISSQGTTLDISPRDSALFYTDFKYKIINFERIFLGSSLGPFINLAYETQFRPIDNPRKKQFRFTVGADLSDGSFFDNLRLGWMIEQEYTFDPSKQERGIYFSSTANFMVAPIRSVFANTIDLKYFFDSETDEITDLGFELTIKFSLKVPVYRSFFIGPYFEYFVFRGKVEPLRAFGTSSTIGVSVGFSEIIKP